MTDSGESKLPLQYEDGPDFCTVRDAQGRDFALTMQPELMKAMEKALSNETASFKRPPVQCSSAATGDAFETYRETTRKVAAAREKGYAAARENLKEAWSALAMIREAVETLAPAGSVKAAEHLDGPTFMHEAEALVAGIRAMSAVPQEAPEIEEVTWLKYIRNCFVAYLAGRYKAGEALEIANWCNKKLDVTGRLLGEVRELARSPLTRPAPQEAWKPIDTVTRFTRCEMRGIYADTDGDGLFAFMATHWRPEVGK